MTSFLAEEIARQPVAISRLLEREVKRVHALIDDAVGARCGSALHGDKRATSAALRPGTG